MSSSNTFDTVEGTWTARLGSLRNVVRQHVIGAQLAEHLDGVDTVFDVGCGQGTQAMRLAERGLAVTGVDPAPDLLARLAADARQRDLDIETIAGDIDSLPHVLGDRTADLVCCHGVLMYLDDAEAAVAALARHVRPGGRLSFTVRNGDALAYRPGIRGDYESALKAFDATRYRNELGVHAHAHLLAEATGWCDALGLTVEAWYGVRVLTDGLPADSTPADVDLRACLAAEVEAGRRDPYRALGSMLHMIAIRHQGVIRTTCAWPSRPLPPQFTGFRGDSQSR